MRKAIALLASCIVLCSMTGCGSSDEKDKGNIDATTKNQETKEDNNVTDDEKTTEETTKAVKTKKEEYEEEFPYVSSIDFTSLPKKDIKFYNDTYNLADLTGDKLLEFIDYAADGKVKVEGEEKVEKFSSIKDILNMKAADIQRVYLYYLDEDAEGIRIMFQNRREGEEEYTVKDCFDKGLWSMQFGPYCFQEDRITNDRNIALYGDIYSGSKSDLYNRFEVTLDKFGKPDYYRVSSVFSSEQIEMMYVNGELAFYTESIISSKDDVKITAEGGFDYAVIAPAKTVVSVEEDADFNDLRWAINEKVYGYKLNDKYAYEWRTPEGPIEEE